MNDEQVAGLLAYVAAIDPRVRRNDPAERRLQVRAWCRQLAGVDFDAACAAADVHYAAPGASAILPGDVRHGARGSEAARHPSARPAAEVLAEQARVAAVDAGPYRREWKAMLDELAAKRALPGEPSSGAEAAG